MKLGSWVTNAINESLAYSKKVVEDMLEKCTRSSLHEGREQIHQKLCLFVCIAIVRRIK